jgi:hypothetical protein
VSVRGAKKEQRTCFGGDNAILQARYESILVCKEERRYCSSCEISTQRSAYECVRYIM